MKQESENTSIENPENVRPWANWLNHELKTPLSRIESLLGNLEKGMTYDFEQQKLILLMKDSLEECKKIIDTLFIYEKLKKGNFEVSFKDKDLNRLISLVVSQNEFLAKRKGISFILETEPIFPIPLDEALLIRALSNILENAIKYSPSESRILISSEEMGDHVLVQIADQGCGISESDFDKIFDPYFRTDRTQDSPGTGLGLALANRFVALHGGKIEVDSVPDKGSTFTVFLKKKGDHE